MPDDTNCPQCTGSGLVPVGDGLLDLCPRCAGYGFFSDEHPDKQPLQQPLETPRGTDE